MRLKRQLKRHVRIPRGWTGMSQRQTKSPWSLKAGEKKLLAEVRPGDFVAIQFGHNDQKRSTEFYRTSVTYSAIPATKQVDSIRMRGNLEVGNTSKAYAMVEEIGKWMKEDFGAVDQIKNKVVY